MRGGRLRRRSEGRIPEGRRKAEIRSPKAEVPKARGEGGAALVELGAKGAGLSNVVAIAAGGSHSLALKSDGSVVGWGSTFAGEALVPPGLCNVVAIAAGGEASLALSAGPQLSSITLNGPSPVLRFHTFLGQSYSVDYSPNLNPGSWLELPGSPIAGDGREAVLTDTNATSGAASRFYRLRQP